MLRNRFPLIFICLTLALCAAEIDAALSQSAIFRRITSTPEESLNLNPTLSGDGLHVAFESTADIAHAGGGNHFRAFKADIGSDPANFIQFSLARAAAPAVSQDGSRIAFASSDDPTGQNLDGNSEIFLFDSTKLIQLTHTSSENFSERLQEGCFRPSISDDGQLVVFSSNRDITGENPDGNSEIFLYDAAASAFIQLTNTRAPLEMSDAKLSGDRSRVAYLRTGADAEAAELLLQEVQSSSKLIVENKLQALSLSYGRAISDDGKRLVYSANDSNGVSQIYLYDGRNNLTRQITSFADFDNDVSFQPTISGDGARIAFATRRTVTDSNADHSVELYLYDLPTSQFTRLTNAPSAAKSEIISSLNDDGSVVAFNFPRIISGATESSANSNNSEIYVSQLAAHVQSFNDLKITNAASQGNEPSANKAVAPASIASARGQALAIATAQAHCEADGRFPASFLGTTVSVNNRHAEILYASPSEVDFVVPEETENGEAQVIITNGDGFQSLGKVIVQRSAPGIFTFSGDGRGPGVILDADTQSLGPFDPTSGQLRLSIFATGLRYANQVTASVAGVKATVESIQISPTLPGLDEIHLLIPADFRGAGQVSMTVNADGADSNTVTLELSGSPVRDLLINEVLADPPIGLAGDANRDGVRSSSQDEFVEIVNTTAHDINMSGYKLLSRSTSGADGVRHSFAQDTILPAGAALVIFGGGAPQANDAAFGGAMVLTASTGSLGPLNNSGGAVTLVDGANVISSLVTYGSAGGLKADANQSITRAPDITGQLTLHQSAAGSNGRAFSPGTHLDGTPFSTEHVSRVEITPAASDIFINGTQQFTAHALDSQGTELSGVIFLWQSSNKSIAAVTSAGVATGLSEGTTEIRASARGVQSTSALLTVKPVPPVLTRIEVTPQNATAPVGVTRKFAAHAFDQFNREMSNVAFTWSSNDESIATVDATGLASAIAQGRSTITASSDDVKGEAVLNVVEPALIFNEVLVDPPGSSSTDLVGDANRDGVRDSGDEFIELVNSSQSAINISGWTIRTRSLTGATSTLRHTFSAGTMIPVGDAIVIFGGGSVDANNPSFGGAQVVKASTGQLSLTNTGLFITVNDSSGEMMAQFAYGGASGLRGDQDQSITRSPDISGSFVLHTAVSSRKFSPGTRADGSFFVARRGRLTSVTLAPLSTEVIEGATAEFTAQAFDQFNRPLAGTAFNFSSSNPSVASIESVDENDASATAILKGKTVGETLISVSATEGDVTIASSSSTLTVKPQPPIITRVEVTPSTSSINRGQTKQLTATAFDQNNQVVAGALFDWASSNASVATVDANGLVKGAGMGSATISASVQGARVSGEAGLNIKVPLVINEILADPPGSSAIDLMGDANRDGVRDSDDDEFVEVLNNSTEAVDVSGVIISDSSSNRFTFPANTILASGRAVIIFGGGNPPASDPAFGGSLIFTTSSLSLNNSGDTVTLKLSVSGSDAVIANESYGAEGGADQSLTRSPDAEVSSTGGAFTGHKQSANSSGRAFSPGTRADGTPFGSPAITRISVSPGSASINSGATQNFTAQAFSNTTGTEVEIPNVSFLWDSGDANKATVAPQTGASTVANGLAAGSVNIRARAGIVQGVATLTVNPPPPVLTSVTIVPSSSNLIVGQSVQFTAQARDQFNNPVGVSSITFSSGDTNLATIDSVTSDAQAGTATARVTGRNAGSVQITAFATDAASRTVSSSASMNISDPPTIPTAGQVIINEALVSFSTSSTQARNDFLELYNTTDQTLDISGLTVSFRPTGSSNTPATITLPGAVGSSTALIPAHSYFLIVNGSETFGVAADFNATGFDMNNTTGGIKIEINGVKLDGLTYQGGTAAPASTFISFGEGALFSFTSGTTNDLIRSPNATDTNNNQSDFRRNGTTSSVTPKAANPLIQ